MSQSKQPRSQFKSSGQVRRLFNQFQPKHYIIELAPDSDGLVFSGKVIISGQKIGRPTNRLTLHANGLKVSSAHITYHGKDSDLQIIPSRINMQKTFNEVRLHSKTLLLPGKYTVSLSYKGRISKQMNGMYPCFFKLKGQDKKLIATQFESHHAREVFPCIDEPEAKATFDLVLKTAIGETVLANTPIIKQTKSGSTLISEFETTPVMSTYLLAFVYGTLVFKSRTSKKGVEVRTYSTPDNKNLLDFALDVAVKCLDFYSDYFGLDYPLKKCDLIALPDFAAGAMENWGCITFREQALLVDPDHTSLANKQYVALVVAHELAHQWFGNLVTMRWWNDLWLNEGFASWIEYLAVDKLFPKWKMWTQFVVDEQQQALKLDALEHTHPVEVPINHPDEIRTIFDAVSYSKGASIIHMLNHYLGEDDFRTGLRYYLSKHAYRNTDTNDLWESLEEASHKPVKSFMEAWTTLPGFPVINAKIDTKLAWLEQSRFFANPRHSLLPPEIWPVPLLINRAEAEQVMTGAKLKLTASPIREFKLNCGQSGFYRTVYNSSHLINLGNLIRRGKLNTLDRLGVLADMVEAAKAGLSDTADSLNFLINFLEESDFAVWDVIAGLIGSLRLVMEDEQLRELMKPFIRNLLSKQLGRLGWYRQTGESHFDRLLRPTILSLAASADEPSIVKRCLDLFAGIKNTDELNPDFSDLPSKGRIKRGTDIDPDLRGTVYGTVARLGSRQDFDKLVKLHNQATLSEIRVTLSAAITGFKQPDLIDRSLKIITSTDVRIQDVVYWIAYSFLNRHAKLQTWHWLKNNWAWLNEHLGNDLSFYRLPIYAARCFSDVNFLNDYRSFFLSVMSPSLDRSFKQGIEMIEAQSAWKQKDLKEVKNFFDSYSKTAKKSSIL